MKTLFNKRMLLISLAFSSIISTSALADNPQIRICRELGGLFYEVSTTESVKEPRQDKLPLCQFGDALAGSQTLIEWTWYGQKTTALAEYMTTGRKTCEDAGGTVIKSKDSNRNLFLLCQFNDGSFIELFTFERGFGHDLNTGLDAALKRASAIYNTSQQQH